MKKIISLVLCLSLIFSAVQLPVMANDAEEPNIYYVSNTGSDENDGLTLNTAFATIDKAQKLLENGGTIMVNGTVDFDGGEPHTEMITIKGVNADAKLNLVQSKWYNQIDNAVALAGPTTFEEIIIPKTTDDKSIRLLTNGHEIILDRESSGNSYVLVWVGNVDNSATSTKTEKITVNNWTGDEWNGLDLRMGAFGDATGRASGGVDVVINGGRLKRLELTKATVFEGNVNLTWNGGSFTTASGSAYDSAIGSNAVFNGAFQFISNNGLGNGILGSAFGSISAADGEWFMYGDTTGGALSTTETAGTFAVKSGYYAKATNQADGKIYYSEDGLLTVPMGTYDVTYNASAPTESAIVYVAETGSDDNDGLTSEKPFATIDKAQTYLKDVNAKEKIIVVSGTVDFDGGEEHADMMTIRGDGTGKIKLVANDGFYPATQTKQMVCMLKGPTTIENIAVEEYSGTYDIFTDGHQLVFGNSVTGTPSRPYIIVGNKGNNLSKVDTLTVNSYPGSASTWKGMDIRLMHGQYYQESKTSGGLNLTLNGGQFVCAIFNTVIYKGNVNITVNGGKYDEKVGQSAAKATFNGAIQVVVNNGLGEGKIDDALKNATAAGGKWFLYGDKTGGMLSSTPKAGRFEVQGALQAVATNRETQEVYESQNGVLKVPAGIYDVTYRIPDNDISTFYVSENGNDQNNGLTIDTAFATITYAQQWLAKSTAQNKTIIVSGTVDFNGGDSHSEMLTIRGADENAKLNLVKTKWYNQINDAVMLAGPTTFEEVIIPKVDTRILTNGHEVVLDRKSSGNSYVMLWVGNVNNSATCTTPEKITVNNWKGDEWNGLDLRIGAFGDATGRAMGDVDIVINGGHLKRMSFERDATINGDVNITLNGGKLTTADGSSYDSAIGSNVVFNGAFQIISNNGLGDGILGSAFSSVEATEGEWFMFGDNTGGKLTMTETPGTYSLSGSTYAEAVNRDDNSVYYAKDGVLTVPAGTYDVTFVEKVEYMLHVTHDGSAYKELLQNVTLEKGKTYAVSYKYKYVTGYEDYSVGFVVANEQPKKASPIFYYQSPKNEFDKVSYGTEWSEVTYLFTLDHTALVDGENPCSVGFQFIQRSGCHTEIYIADMTLYDTTDARQKNLLSVSNYDNSMYGWHSGWLSAGKDSTVFTDGYTAEYELYVPEYFKNIGYGDANQDTQIDVKDLVKLKVMQAEESYSTYSDCDKDGKLSSEDLKVMRKHLVGTEQIQTVVLPFQTQNGGADAQANTMKKEITNNPNTIQVQANKTYYVDSENGNDSNTGLSEAQALKTISAVNKLSINNGGVVLFKRGSEFRTAEPLYLKSDVNYGTYGEGEKPQILGSVQNYADAEWIATETEGVWKLAETVSGEAGVVTFDGDTAVGNRVLSLDKLKKQGDYYHNFGTNGDGSFYLYLKDVNPTEYFRSIEIGATEYLAKGQWNDESAGGFHKNDVILENIVFRYCSNTAFDLSHSENVAVKGCEFLWIGGAVMSNGTGYGNAITLWRDNTDISIDKCLFYQIYDAAVTFQGNKPNYSTTSPRTDYENISCTNSVIEYSSMNFEFWGTNSTLWKGDDGIAGTEDDDLSLKPVINMNNITFSNNMIRFGGYGFGGLNRTDKASQSCLLGWSYEYYDTDTITNFNITNNTMDVAECYMFYVPSTLANRMNISGNSYYQKKASYKVNRAVDFWAVDQESFERAIDTFDSNPTKVQWLE